MDAWIWCESNKNITAGIHCRERRIPVGGIRFVQWIALYNPIAPGVNLISDGYAEFMTPSGIEAMFIEVDLGHESLRVWREKAKQYLHFAVSGGYARHFKGSRFRVLMLVNSERRMHSLRAAVVGVTQKSFWLATLDETRGKKFYTPAWLLIRFQKWPNGGEDGRTFSDPASLLLGENLGELGV
jgi:hypothetical protein